MENQDDGDDGDDGETRTMVAVRPHHHRSRHRHHRRHHHHPRHRNRHHARHHHHHRHQRHRRHRHRHRNYITMMAAIVVIIVAINTSFACQRLLVCHLDAHGGKPLLEAILIEISYHETIASRVLQPKFGIDK